MSLTLDAERASPSATICARPSTVMMATEIPAAIFAVRLSPDHQEFPQSGPADIIQCDTDQEAIERAKQLVDGHDIELWNGPRFVIGLKSMESNNEEG